MRRLVAALTLVALALVLAGCGGGGEAETTTTQTSAAPPAPLEAPAGLTVDDRSANASDTFTPFPTGEAVPADLAQQITVDKRPTIIYFYESGQNTSKEVRSIIDAVREDNRGLVELATYDLSQYTKAGSDGAVSVDPALSTDAAATQAAGLARVLGVSFTPYIVLTDSQGQIIYAHRGLVDRDFLEREVLRASD